MKLFRVFVFIFFAVALHGSIDCLMDSERSAEHAGAWMSVYICALGCLFATININT